MSAFVISGRSGYMAVPIVLLPLLTAGAYLHFRASLPEFCQRNAEMVIATVAGLTGVLLLVAAFLRGRRLEVGPETLRYRSWFGERVLAIAELSQLTFETEVSGSNDDVRVQHFLALWAGDRARLKFNTQYWARDDLQRLITHLRARQPTLQLDRDVERYRLGR